MVVCISLNKNMLVNWVSVSTQVYEILAHDCQICQPQGKRVGPILGSRRSMYSVGLAFDCSTEDSYPQALLAELPLLQASIVPREPCKYADDWGAYGMQVSE